MDAHKRSADLNQLICQYHPIVIAAQETHLRFSHHISHPSGSSKSWPNPRLRWFPTHDFKIVFLPTLPYYLQSPSPCTKSEHSRTSLPPYHHLNSYYCTLSSINHTSSSTSRGLLIQIFTIAITSLSLFLPTKSSFANPSRVLPSSSLDPSKRGLASIP